MIRPQSFLGKSQQHSSILTVWHYIYKFCINLTQRLSKEASYPCWTENPLGFSPFMGIQAS